MQEPRKSNHIWDEKIELQIEPARLFPRYCFTVNPYGEMDYSRFSHVDWTQKKRWYTRVERSEGRWVAFFRIPFASIHYRNSRYRVNVIRHVVLKEKSSGNVKNCQNRWIEFKGLEKPVPVFGKEDPAFNFGWLILQKNAAQHNSH